MNMVKTKMRLALDTGSQRVCCRVNRMAPYRLALVGLGCKTGHYGPFSVQASLKAQQSHSWPGGTGPVFLAGGWGLLTREHFNLCWVGELWSELMYENSWEGGSGPLRLGNLGLRLC